MHMKKPAALFFYLLVALQLNSQTVSSVWVADNKNGTFNNPVIHADYSDPDAIRVGKDYYMVASSFNHVPGLPILHSNDLVNWKLIAYALKELEPVDFFSTVQHGKGVWAPSIRYHNNEFYIFYPDPDFGIYVIKAKNIKGPWTKPVLVQGGKGLIDPCPLWDDNGKVYLVHAYAGSRAGFKSVIVVKELNKEATKVIGDAVMVYDGHTNDPTIEGPKFYKRNGYYYIFAPAGGVSTGWQTVLRSKSVYGPYERKVVMDAGNTTINGPHQGAWVNTITGEDWFLHFQDKEAYGRIVHLQPMKWVNDWPVIGEDKNATGKGQPVNGYKKPDVGKTYPVTTVADTDEFNNTQLGLQWQWQANAKEGWAYTTPMGYLRFFSALKPDSLKNLWMLPNILAQKLPAEQFKATVKLKFHPNLPDEQFGLILFGTDYATLQIKNHKNGTLVIASQCINAEKGNPEKEIEQKPLPAANDYYLRMIVSNGGICTFFYSIDGVVFNTIGKPFTAKPGKWVGAKMGLYMVRDQNTNNAGYADIDWFRVEKE